MLISEQGGRGFLVALFFTVGGMAVGFISAVRCGTQRHTEEFSLQILLLGRQGHYSGKQDSLSAGVLHRCPNLFILSSCRELRCGGFEKIHEVGSTVVLIICS